MNNFAIGQPVLHINTGIAGHVIGLFTGRSNQTSVLVEYRNTIGEVKEVYFAPHELQNNGPATTAAAQ